MQVYECRITDRFDDLIHVGLFTSEQEAEAAGEAHPIMLENEYKELYVLVTPMTIYHSGNTPRAIYYQRERAKGGIDVDYFFGSIEQYREYTERFADDIFIIISKELYDEFED